MSKVKTSMKYITNLYNRVFRAGYCDLANIFYTISPVYYNAGVYGWNCDIYAERGMAITTGYRNMRGKSIPIDVLKKYDDEARAILEDYRWKDYDKKVELLSANMEKFLDELEKL